MSVHCIILVLQIARTILYVCVCVSVCVCGCVCEGGWGGLPPAVADILAKL